MAGLLQTLSDLKFRPNPLSMGLLQAGSNMLQAGGPSPQPINFGSALGAGLQGFNQGFMGANEQAFLQDYKNQMLDRQAKQDANPGTPGQWYIPPGAEPFIDKVTGITGYKTKEGAIIPSRAAMTDYQTAMTSPEQQAAIAKARTAATESEKVREVKIGPEGTPGFAKTGDLTGIIPGLIQTESSGNPAAVSPADAYGLGQITDPVAMKYAGKKASELTPSENIRVAGNYLADLTKQYNEDYDTGLQAYNMGPGNIAKGRGNKAYANKVLGNAGLQTEAEKEQLKADIEVKKAGDKKLAEAAAEKKAEAPNKLRLIRNRLAEIEEGIKALQPSEETDKISGSPKKFGFEAGGFMGGSGVVPSAYYDITNNPNYRTLQRVSSSEELQRAIDDMAKQGAITESERQILRLGVGFDPSSNRSSQIYNQLVKSRDRIKELYKQLGGEDMTAPSSGEISDEELDARLERLSRGR